MFNLTDAELSEYIKSDLPYFDLTTYLLDSSEKKAKMEIFTREDTVVSCSEEAKRIAELLGCEVEFFIPSKQKAKKEETLLSFSGGYENVHQAWRSSQVIMEYSCKIATYAHMMKEQIDLVNPDCQLLATRKSFPFAKRFCIKSIMCGGAMPHRLSLSETVLLFAQHRIVFENDKAFYAKIEDLKAKVPEKKIVVESECFDDALNLIHSGVDVLQMDKVDIQTFEKLVEYKNQNFPHIKILASGGVNIANAKEYAATKIDGIVTSAMYSCGMGNIGTRMKIVS